VTKLVEPAPEPASHLESRRTWYVPDRVPRTERVLRVFDDGHLVPDGAERRWYADGTHQSEQFFRMGQPFGTWRSWYPSGAPRSEVPMGDTAAPQPMSFWHENGQLSGAGKGLNGVREGPWSYWSEDGTLSYRGTFVHGLREGHWEFFEADGSPREEREYARGVLLSTRFLSAEARGEGGPEQDQ